MTHPLQLFRFCPRCGSEHFVEDSWKSKRCEQCGFEYFLNPSASVIAIIRNNKGEILVSRRAKEPAKGTLDLPGGFCDIHETSEEALAREIKEETGMRVTRAKYLFSVTDRYEYSGFVLHTLDNVFLCDVDTMDITHPMDDVAELMWMRLEDLRIEDFGLEAMHECIRKLREVFLLA